MDMTGKSILPACIHCRKTSFGSCSTSRRPSGGDGVQRFRDQQVDIAIVQLQRSQAGVIVAHVKCGAQRIVILRHLAQRGHFALAARGDCFRLRSAADCAQGQCVSAAQNSGSSGLRTTFTTNTTSTSVKSPPVISSTRRVRRQRRRSCRRKWACVQASVQSKLAGPLEAVSMTPNY